jgi:signal transduction histidine kinase/ActR/RegA family two-component response regulator
MRVIIAFGSAALLISAYKLPVAQLDLRFLLLALMVGLSSHVSVRIPHVSGCITVSDTLIFLTLLLYGGEAAVLMSALEGVYGSLRISRKSVTVLFNVAVLSLSTFFTSWALQALGTLDLTSSDYSANSLIAVFVMALTQYFINTGLISIEKSLKLGEPLWQTWKTYYLWTSVTYLAGASAAAITARLIHTVGFYSVFATIPTIAIIYLTYRTYLKNIENSEAHVEELSRYVAELKRSEEERAKILLSEREARADAEAASRVKDEFLSTLSHELRTPLTSIIGWSSLLRSGQLNGEVKAQALETIERNAKIQSQLIDDLLDVSRIISGKLLLNVQDVSLAGILADSIEAVRPAAAAKNIQLTHEYGREQGIVSGDSARLQQIAWNLLSNAVKFTPEGGRVHVRLERKNDAVTLSVHDTGKGIDTEFLPHVFDRFRQADSATTRLYGGLGLGLAIVRHLVEMQGGTVGAESPGEGKGATFFVTLPLAPAGLCQNPDCSPSALQLSAATASMPAPSEVLAGLRILVVDDEFDTRQVISTVIAQFGGNVIACASAAEALEALQRFRPDILMSDIGMPGEDGYALIRQVRALPLDCGGATPAAALTAYARDEDRRRALSAGYQLHIAKPFSPQDLIAAVTNLHSHAATGVV